MAASKFASTIACVTGVTLLLQLVILYKNQCHFSRAREIGLSDYDEESKIEPLSRHLLKQAMPFHDIKLPHLPRKRHLTVGIPTVKRKEGSYLLEMLGSMFNKTSAEDLKEIVFVVFLADINNTEWKSEIEQILKSKYSKHYDSGTLRVIQAPAEFYDNMPVFKNDSYTNWRTKQNYDYAYIMKYCEELSDYYMQMEDDVFASGGYYGAITDFVKEQTDNDWICLEFSELGFIGKLYRSKHIGKLAAMLLMFSHSQPVDYTFLYFNTLMGQGNRGMRKPTLFQHLGYHSSLAEKKQPLRDRYFDFPEKQLNGDNPPAQLATSLEIHPDFPPELSYSKKPGYFWSRGGAKVNDTFTIVFDLPQVLEQVIVETGSKEHQGDYIHNGVVEASPSLVVIDNNKPKCLNFMPLGNFLNGSAKVDDITQKMGLFKIHCLQIRITSAQVEWVIVREMALFHPKN